MQINNEHNKVRKIIEEELEFSGSQDSYDNWIVELRERINDLILNDFDKLIFLLYRLDVNESKLKKLLKINFDSDAGEIIGKLIVERQLQKIKSREDFRQPDAGIDEDDKW